MTMHYRKTNRINSYDYSRNGAYFVTICTQKRQRTLSQIVGDGFPVPTPQGKIAEEWILHIPSKYPDVSVDQYVIMPDHIHMLLMIDRTNGTGNPSPTLGNIIGWYKYQVTKCVNATFGSQGDPFFQRSYYDHVIRNQQDYDETWQYIANNPKNWILQQYAPKNTQ